MEAKIFHKIAQLTGIKEIVNDISTLSSWQEYTRPDGSGSYRQIFTPITSSYHSSNWMICLPVRYKGTTLYAWFRVWMFDDHKFIYLLDHVWDGGRGKKLRRDAKWNIEYDLTCRAEKALQEEADKAAAEAKIAHLTEVKNESVTIMTNFVKDHQEHIKALYDKKYYLEDESYYGYLDALYEFIQMQLEGLKARLMHAWFRLSEQEIAEVINIF
jgi:hypothetical protein